MEIDSTDDTCKQEKKEEKRPGQKKKRKKNYGLVKKRKGGRKTASWATKKKKKDLGNRSSGITALLQPPSSPKADSFKCHVYMSITTAMIAYIASIANTVQVTSMSRLQFINLPGIVNFFVFVFVFVLDVGRDRRSQDFF